MIDHCRDVEILDQRSLIVPIVWDHRQQCGTYLLNQNLQFSIFINLYRQNSRPQSSVGGRTATRLATSLGQQSQPRERIGTALENAGNVCSQM